MKVCTQNMSGTYSSVARSVRRWNNRIIAAEESMCGCLKDKSGLSSQIVPSALGELMGDPDPVKAKRVVDAMLQMRKIVVADLERAYNNQ